MKILTALALSLLAVAPMRAGDGKFGLQATASRPSGDVGDANWMDGKLGFGVGVHGLIPLGGGVALVPRADYTIYNQDGKLPGSGGLVNQDEKIRILSAGADFHYYLGGEPGLGFYLLGGLGYARGKFDGTYAALGIETSVDATKDAPYFQGGLGVQFNEHVGVEVRYQSLEFRNVESKLLGVTSKQDLSCPSLQASLVVRF